MVRIGDKKIAPTRKGADFRMVTLCLQGLMATKPEGDGRILPFGGGLRPCSVGKPEVDYGRSSRRGRSGY